MGYLWIFYDQTYQCQQLSDVEREEISIGNKRKNNITIQSIEMKQDITIKKYQTPADGLEIFLGEDSIGYLNDKVVKSLSIDQHVVRILYRKGTQHEKVYYIGNQSEVHFPVEQLDEKMLAFSLVKVEGKWSIAPIIENVYVNGEVVHQVSELSSGDVIFHPYAISTLTEEDTITVLADQRYLLPLPELKMPTTVMKEKYPNYRRTPRMMYDLPDEKIEFSFPREESDHSGRGLWMIVLPPLVMLIVMGVVALVRPRGIFILISIAMFTTTIITSTVQYFRERKKQREKEEKRQRLYKRYMETKREELQELAQKQQDVLYYHYPSFERMKYLTQSISDRIWERTRISNDFLQFRIGRATIPSSYDVSVSSVDMSNQEIDELLEKSQELVEHYKNVRNVPLVIDLYKGIMGMVGKHQVVKKEIHQLVGQLSFFQSYHDIRFVAIFHEEEYKSWEWMKWLPHFQLPHVYAKGLIYNEKTRDQLLTTIYEILKERDLTEDKEKKLFTPHFIFIVTNRQLISEHLILEYLEGIHTNIGISAIFAEDTKESLSENINTLVRYIDEENGEILIQDGKAVHLSFTLDQHSVENNERFARMLRSLNHQLGMSNSIPDKVTFLELLQANQVSDLTIEQKWLENHSAKSLAVPIGLKGKDDPVYLNLHEKAHGPHGLLAGTTGSGKSEFLQTYILSLAVHFHPHEVAFLLIDYKGGGMAQPFKNMPHLLGTITNIEGSKNFSKRALASIKSELKRRQRLFDKSEVNHINDYSSLYKEGKVKQPMPHLFLISDEFAELKSEEPEFIRELVSAARIGRSLGVHLILATQKPGGIIDDQIWSNSRFKVALKVQDENDSREILKNSDAANITITGRGYLQVGNNEVYELFQSAWSGAPYAKEAFETEDEIALVTDLGLIPLSEVTEDVGGNKDNRIEIDVVVNEIIHVQERLHIPKVASPWLPPLSERLPIPTNEQLDRHQIIIGLMDEPELQRQSNHVYLAMDDGNIGIYGSSGYGKSMTLLSFLLQFSRKNNPEQFHMYVFDFGNGALLPLKQLPHMADYFRADEQRKMEKFFSIIQEEMEKRKKLFQEQEVSNIKMYNTLASVELPLIFITIDNYDIVKDELFELENKFIQIARDGQSLGIYMVIATTRPNAMKQAMMSNLKTKVVHYLMDESEKFNLVGRTVYETEAIPGRAYIKKDESTLAQIYLPAMGKNDVELLENMKLDIQTIKGMYNKFNRPKAIPMLPEKLGFIVLNKNYNLRQSEDLVAIGLNEDTVEPVYVDWKKNKHCIVMADGQKGKSNVLKIILHSIVEVEHAKVIVSDSMSRSLSDYADDEKVTYLESKEHIKLWVEEAEEEFRKRDALYREALNERRASSLSFPPYMLVVDGMGQFQQNIDAVIQGKLANIIKSYSHLGFHFVVSGNVNEVTKGFDALTTEVKQIKQVILLMKKSEQNLINLPYTRKETEMKVGFGYLVENGDAVKIQIARFDMERVKTESKKTLETISIGEK
ncbi:type VII secretion protein EssC [Paucisalibacillus globulus]|uniref:type VII secretion protein EssC n=1 Tax=Paucisalibacillus globulus TaxID=351095 RepID=UPI000424E745|nr:type VII secretion protein EssC [Paucisalibacillus globulus]